MKTTSAKLQKTSDKVYEELKKQGFSKLYNSVDYKYFKTQAQHFCEASELVSAIVNLFLTYNDEPSDFADYEF